VERNYDSLLELATDRYRHHWTYRCWEKTVVVVAYRTVGARAVAHLRPSDQAIRLRSIGIGLRRGLRPKCSLVAQAKWRETMKKNRRYYTVPLWLAQLTGAILVMNIFYAIWTAYR